MAVPKKKTSKAKKNMRRSHDAISAVGLGKCPDCGAPKRPHSVCEECGTYKGKQILTVQEEAIQE